MKIQSLTRREFWTVLAGLAASGRPALAAGPSDQGIGGTGAVPTPDENQGDRGIGGTGVVGTIQKFGSIYVNGLRIAYPDSAVVRVDGEPGTVKDLRVGQIVRVAAHEDKGAYSTQTINVTSEVVGPVQSVAAHGLTVLGQSVSLAGLKSPGHWRVGDFVAISGLRRPDGTIVASLVSARPAGRSRVAGVVKKGADGALSIGGLRLQGAEEALVGQRAVFEGRPIFHGLDVASQASETSLLEGLHAQRLSIEGYVARNGESLELGSGLRILGGGAGLAQHGFVHAIVHADLDQAGRLAVSGAKPVRILNEPHPAHRSINREAPSRGGEHPFGRENRFERTGPERPAFGRRRRLGGGSDTGGVRGFGGGSNAPGGFSGGGLNGGAGIGGMGEGPGLGGGLNGGGLNGGLGSGLGGGLGGGGLNGGGLGGGMRLGPGVGPRR